MIPSKRLNYLNPKYIIFFLRTFILSKVIIKLYMIFYMKFCNILVSTCCVWSWKKHFQNLKSNLESFEENFPHSIKIRLAPLNFFLLLPDVEKSLPCWLHPCNVEKCDKKLSWYVKQVKLKKALFLRNSLSFSCKLNCDIKVTPC